MSIKLNYIEISTLDQVRNALQTAVELEHSTIPPYLTAAFTLQGTSNKEIQQLIGSVVIEEMLHLSIACNILNAIAGSPVLNQPGFIPTYPGPLPGGVESGLRVGIEKFSMELVEWVFMAIEEPDEIIEIKTELLKVSFPEAQPRTIGEFYTQIKNTMIALEKEYQAEGKTIFTGDPHKQMTNEKWFPASELFPIIDIDTAVRGIDLIIDQGEGSSTDPFINGVDDNGDAKEPAHYYRFQEILKGRKLIRKPGGGFSFGGTVIPYNDAAIPNMWPNPKMNDYPTDSLAYVNSRLFNINYTNLLNNLHETFNGQPEKINAAMGLMFSIKLYAQKLLELPDPNHTGYVAGPSFEFVANDGMNP